MADLLTALPDIPEHDQHWAFKLLIAEEKAGGFTAAVQPHVEGVIGPVTASEEDFSAALLQILFGSAEQFAADALPAMTRTNAEYTGHADGLRIEGVLRHQCGNGFLEMLCGHSFFLFVPQ